MQIALALTSFVKTHVQSKQSFPDLISHLNAKRLRSSVGKVILILATIARN